MYYFCWRQSSTVGTGESQLFSIFFLVRFLPLLRQNDGREKNIMSAFSLYARNVQRENALRKRKLYSKRNILWNLLQLNIRCFFITNYRIMFSFLRCRSTFSMWNGRIVNEWKGQKSRDSRTGNANYNVSMHGVDQLTKYFEIQENLYGHVRSGFCLRAKPSSGMQEDGNAMKWFCRPRRVLTVRQ